MGRVMILNRVETIVTVMIMRVLTEMMRVVTEMIMRVVTEVVTMSR